MKLVRNFIFERFESIFYLIMYLEWSMSKLTFIKFFNNYFLYNVGLYFVKLSPLVCLKVIVHVQLYQLPLSSTLSFKVAPHEQFTYKENIHFSFFWGLSFSVLWIISSTYSKSTYILIPCNWIKDVYVHIYMVL